MSEFKGTNGAWAVCEHSWAETSVIGDGRRIALLSIESEATEENQYELEVRQLADARLMASSKDLLEALQYATKQVPELADVPGISAAIRKALGEDA